MICKSSPDVCNNLDSQCPLASGESCMATAFQHLRHDYIKSKKSCWETIAELGVCTNWKHKKRKYQRFKVHDNWRCSIILPFSRQFPAPNPPGASWRAGPESEKAKQAVVRVRLVKMAASRRLQKQPECKMFGARGTYMVKRETTPMMFGLSFSGDLFPVGKKYD